MDKKKLAELVGSIFIAIIFLTSYAAFGSNSTTPAQTTTILPSQTYYAAALGNASIASYGSVLNINISCSNATAVSKQLGGMLTSLESNGSVTNFYSQQASQILVQAGSEGTYGIYGYLSKGIGSNATCTDFDSSANIQLPSRMNFYVPSQRTSVIIPIPTSLRSYSVSVKFVRNMSGTLGVSVSALLTANGTIYGNMTVRSA